MDVRSFLACAAILFTAGCGSSITGDLTSDPALDPEENEALYELNRLREDAGIAAPMIVCTPLNVSSSTHSDDMRDKGYLDDTAPDGSTVRTRSCSAGYQPGCVDTTVIGELVASGIDTGKEVIAQWAMNPDAKVAMQNPVFVVAGVGRAVGEGGATWWSLDLGGTDDPSCAQ